MRGDNVQVRYRVTTFGALAEDPAEEGSDVVRGLTGRQKTLPCRYFYDEKGAALFERICDLEEYYLTRTEEAILGSCAREIVDRVGHAELVELGSGAARKTRILLEAMNELDRPLRYLPVDVNGAAIEASARALLRAYPALRIRGFSGTYEQALGGLPGAELPARLLMFLGSTFGNFDDAEATAFLALVREALAPGEHFLLGVDLHKERARLEAAYNDARGVTAEFNRNLLRHVNRRFRGNFVLERFRHLAFYDEGERRIEMHLEACGEQRATLRALHLEVGLRAGETIRTEISRKFELSPLVLLFAENGFRHVCTWTDPKGWFAVVLWRRG